MLALQFAITIESRGASRILRANAYSLADGTFLLETHGEGWKLYRFGEDTGESIQRAFLGNPRLKRGGEIIPLAPDTEAAEGDELVVHWNEKDWTVAGAVATVGKVFSPKHDEPAPKFMPSYVPPRQLAD